MESAPPLQGGAAAPFPFLFGAALVVVVFFGGDIFAAPLDLISSAADILDFFGAVFLAAAFFGAVFVAIGNAPLGFVVQPSTSEGMLECNISLTSGPTNLLSA